MTFTKVIFQYGILTYTQVWLLGTLFNTLGRFVSQYSSVRCGQKWHQNLLVHMLNLLRSTHVKIERKLRNIWTGLPFLFYLPQLLPHTSAFLSVTRPSVSLCLFSHFLPTSLILAFSFFVLFFGRCEHSLVFQSRLIAPPSRKTATGKSKH